MSAEVSVEAPGYDLKTFCARSGRFLFAAPRDSPDDRSGDTDLVYLDQGTADERRVFTKTHLRCPDPGCPAPDLTTVNRTRLGRRDGYRHLRRATKHEPESMLHIQAKALVARWAANHPTVASVEVEARLGDGERVADVLLVSHSGNRLAVEVQYAGLTIEQWERRTRSYLNMGVPVTWLWGNTGAHSPSAGRLNAVHREAAARGFPLLWINPVDETIAWAYGPTVITSIDTGPLPVTGPHFGAHFSFGALNDLTLHQYGLRPPGWHAALARRRTVTLDEEAERSRLAAAAVEEERLFQDRIAAARAARAERDAHRLARTAEERELGLPVIRHCRRCGYPLPTEWAASGITQHSSDCDRLG